MRLTRRRLVAGAAASALGAAGAYELVDRLAGEPPRRAEPRGGRGEQHLLDLRVEVDGGVEVLVPPRHHEVLTFRVTARGRAELRDARRTLDEALLRLDGRFDPRTPAGLGTTLAWALPYFTRHVGALAQEHLPVDRRASRDAARPVRALLDAERFPSDGDDVLLEANDLAVLLRSDRRGQVDAGARAVTAGLAGAAELTSIRRGFVGGGLPAKLATAAGVPGADLVPRDAQLFLGFTSTQRAGLGPGRIANLETLGWTDAAGGYFHGGTHMHLSHLYEDLEAWYLNFDFRERVDTAFRPGVAVAPGTLTVPQAPEDVEPVEALKRGFMTGGRFGHSGALQAVSRLHEDALAPDGTVYRKGTAVPQRADFNTLDNPFAWSSRPRRDGAAPGAAAGVHFVVFNPSSDDFRRNRLAMDGVLPDGTKLPLPPRSRGQGFNAVLRTTHRQNFLVPPRERRSFPLVELL